MIDMTLIMGAIMSSVTFTHSQKYEEFNTTLHGQVAENWTIEEKTGSDNGTIEWQEEVNAYLGNSFMGTFTAQGITPNGNYRFISYEDETVYYFSNGGTPETQNSPGVATYDYTVPCFLRGTLIATEGGAVAVEDLAIGDLVKTMDGGSKPISWIGKRSYLRLFTPLNSRNKVMPIRIAAGALAEGVPARDLHLSPKHALLVNGQLVAPELLVNGTTITRMDLERVDYFHIKLEAHDVIFAEGAPAETYVVHGNLKSFNNWPEHEALFGPVENESATADYAPRLRKGPALDVIRQQIAARADTLGHGAAKAG